MSNGRRLGGRGAVVLACLFVVAVVGLVSRPGTARGEQGGNVDAGRDVFEANCAMCHGGDAAGMMGMHPSLRGAVERLSREGVEVTIRKGRDTSPPMPAWEGRLTDQEIADVIAYLDSLPAGPRNFGPGASMMDDGGMMHDHGGMMDGMMDGMTGGGGMVGVFMMVLYGLLVLLLVALGVAALVWLVQRLRGGATTPPRDAQPSPARGELDRRYAAGELSRDEYLERRRDLES
jgi:putative membrane protein